MDKQNYEGPNVDFWVKVIGKVFVLQPKQILDIIKLRNKKRETGLRRIVTILNEDFWVNQIDN